MKRGAGRGCWLPPAEPYPPGDACTQPRAPPTSPGRRAVLGRREPGPFLRPPCSTGLPSDSRTPTAPAPPAAGHTRARSWDGWPSRCTASGGADAEATSEEEKRHSHTRPPWGRSALPRGTELTRGRSGQVPASVSPLPKHRAACAEPGGAGVAGTARPAPSSQAAASVGMAVCGDWRFPWQPGWVT